MADNVCSASEREQVLASIPQTHPFRFIDEVRELSDAHIVASYRFRGDEFFFAGHFPGDPVTPGVILVEAMAQAGLVVLGTYLLQREGLMAKMRTLFSECAVEFLSVVRPGDTVIIRGEKMYWRRHKLKSRVELTLESGTIAAVGTVAGLGVAIA